MCGGLCIGRALKGALSTLAPVVYRGVIQTCFREMMSEEFGLGRCEFRKAFLQHMAYSCVQIPPASAQQRVVCGVLNKRVLEDVIGVRRRPATKYEAGLSELVERTNQLRVRPTGN